MVSFVQHTIFFLAGVSLVVSNPAGNLQKTENEITTNQEEEEGVAAQVNLGDPNAVNVLDAVTSTAELTDDQKIRLQKPLAELIKDFDGTLFGSLFSFIMKRLQNPTEFTASDLNEAEILKKTPLHFKSFILTLQKLDDKVIERSQPAFDEIFEILGDAKFSIFFREVLATLKMRHDLFQYAGMSDAMLKNLPNMLADPSKVNLESVQQLMNPESVQKLIQNPESIQKLIQTPGVAALIPGLAKMQMPGKVDILPSSVTNLKPLSVDAINAAKSIASRVRLNPTPKVYVPRSNSMLRGQGLPSFKPSILGEPKGTMTV